ncbi:MAG TPA: alkaline phosphatase family protein, partial [Pseudomonadales bacterium]|nr:alkaline phosphatase family protein [Pseudomonadales bacterium]
GANGLANAGEAARQVDLNDQPYKRLPPVMNTNKGPAIIDKRFPARLANEPFLVDQYVRHNQTTGDLVHRFYQEQMQINDGKMNKFAAVSDAGGLTMGYYDFAHSAHWQLAQTYTLADNAFHSAFGGSFLNHAFLVCACAFEWKNADASLVAKLDANGKLLKDGQVSPDGYAINTARSVYLHAPNDVNPAKLVPPQTLPNIGDRLTQKGVSWKWYGGGYRDALAGKPDAEFQFHHQPLAYFKNYAPGTELQKQHLQDQADFYADIANNQLPQVVFYKPIGELNLHPGYANIKNGDAHLAEIMAKLQASPAWQTMLVIVTFDENGGIWDHVAPPKRDRWGPGTRVPLILAGPGVKRNFVDHTQYETVSILKTIEERFGLEPLNEIDKNANSLRSALISD